MKKVLILKGLPGSGKSTLARSMMEKEPGKWKRINKDDLRAMMDGGSWSGKNEDFILRIRDLLIVEALTEGKNVIVDDTNLHSKHEQKIREIVDSYNRELDVFYKVNDNPSGKFDKKEIFEVEVKFIDTPISECIERDLKRPNSVGEKVIRKMYSQFLREKPIVVKPNPSLPNALIVDMDGTLALHNGRSPYDTEKCETDLVNEPIAFIVRCVSYIATNKVRTLIVSGRDDIYQPHTERWLKANRIPYDEVWMRKAGDKRDDAVVKKEIYEQHIKGKYNVLFVLDDRPRVCRMWYSEGLTLLKVGDPDAEF